MSQEDWLILVLKIALISGFCSLAAWVAVYSALAAWWTNAIGRTLVTKTVLIALLFIPSTLSLFFNLNRLDSLIVGWIDAGLIALVSPVMWWRSAVWVRESRKGKTGDGTDEKGDASA